MNGVNRSQNIKLRMHIHTLFSSYLNIERGNGVNHYAPENGIRGEIPRPAPRHQLDLHPANVGP